MAWPWSLLMRRSGVSSPAMKAVMMARRVPSLPPEGTRYQVVAAVSDWSTRGSHGLTTTVKRPETRFGKTNRSWLPSASTLTWVYSATDAMRRAVNSRLGGTTSAYWLTVTGRPLTVRRETFSMAASTEATLSGAFLGRWLPEPAVHLRPKFHHVFETFG